MMYECLLVGCSHLLGTIPTGYIISKYMFGRDIRLYGSGNIGATNMARVHGKWLFFPILLIDALKAYVAVTLGLSISPFCGLICGSACFTGNIFSLLLGGVGGKGVATMLGIVCAIKPLLGVCFSILWICTLSAVSRAGIASVISLVSLTPLAFYLDCDVYQCMLLAVMSAVSIWRHSSNIMLFFRSWSPFHGDV